MKKTLIVAVFVAAILFPLAAHAGDLPIFQGSAGALFTVGGDLWTKPKPAAPEGPGVAIPFNDTAGGVGVGGGMFFEARFIKYIGLEIGLLFEHNRQWFDIDYNSGAAELRYLMRYTNVRLPILVKGVIETSRMRVSLGLGPEFVFSRGDKSDIEELQGNVTNLNDLRALFHTKQQNDVFLCVALGFAFKVWKLSIPFNIRYSHNFTQPKPYEKRIGDVLAGEYDLVASQSMDLRLMLGVAYDF